MRLLRSLSIPIGGVCASILLIGLQAAAQSAGVPARVTQRVDAENLVTLRGNTHPLARPEYDQGAAPVNLPMERMLLVLQRSSEQETALRQLLEEQQTHSSPNYHRWLTPQEFGQRFGPADTDVQAVTDWLLRQGFQVNRVAAGRTIIEFSGSAELVRQALHTEIHKFVVNGEEHWANASDPEIPAALAPVVAGVASLNNFPRKPLVQRFGTFSRSKATGEVRPLFTYTSQGTTSYAVGPGDFATIYNLPTNLDGTGQTIAIVEQSNINLQDVRDFRSMFGLPAKDPQIILNGPDPGIVSGDEGEADLDVQWAGAVAKNATIQLVVSESTESSAGIDLSALYIVDNNLAPVMSESYGACEASLGVAGNAFYNAIWEQAAAQGITVIVSAGDSGSAGCDGLPGQTAAQSGLAVSGLASTPFNLALGGTDFDDVGAEPQYWTSTNTAPSQSSAKSYIPEATWNDSCAVSGALTGCTTVAGDGSDLVAGGGGPSNCALSSACGPSAAYPKPSWQAANGVPSDGVRDIPDISLFSSDGQNGSFYVFCQQDANTGTGSSTSSCDVNSPYQNFQGAGGTSFAAPSFAGIMAMVNQKTGARQGNANYVLYKLAAQSGASCASNATMAPTASSSSCIFYDTVKGNISVACVGGSPNCSKTTAGGYGILVSGSTPAWTTSAGYDLATGLGTVNAANLVNNWGSVTFTPSTTTLSLSTNPATNPITLTHGQPVTVNITVAPQTPPAPTTPTGTVALMGGLNGPLGITAFALTNGAVTNGSTSMLPGGTYNVTAHYAGDGTFGASDSPPVSVTVSQEGSLTKVSLVTFDVTTGAVTSPNAPGAAYGSPYVLRVGVTNSSGNPCAPSVNGSIVSIVYPCPTGAVTVTANGNPLIDQGAPPGSSPTNFTLNSAGYLEDAFVQLPPLPLPYTIAANYAGDNGYTASFGSTPITITPALTTTSVSVSPSSVLSGQTVTLTALVNTQSNGAAPTGAVQFLNGSTPLSGTVTYLGSAYSTSTGALAVLQATLSATFTSTASITAKYSGDASYAASTSAPLAITVADFSVSASPSSLVIASPGLSATSTLNVTASGGFAGTVNLSCTVPAAMSASTCALNPTSVAGSGSTTLKVTTTAPSAVVGPFDGPGWLLGAAIVAGLFLLGVPGRRRRMKLARGLLCLGLMAAAFVACGGGGGGTTTHNPGTPAGTYTITVTATSSSLTHTTNVSVTVQ